MVNTFACPADPRVGNGAKGGAPPKSSGYAGGYTMMTSDALSSAHL
jgi:hypothetical protein